MESDTSKPPFPPLAKGSHEIRLLKLSRAQGGLEPSGTLEVYNLDTPKKSPNRRFFETLSYVWGDPKKKQKEILINGTLFGILDSIYSFIQLATSADDRFKSETLWWIDSICIDQNDPEERTDQVKLMGRIYSEAIGTTIWLGDKSEDSDKGVEFLKDLAIKRNLWVNPETGTVLLSKYIELSGPRYVEGWKAFANLLLRPWFKRVWTLQEFFLAPSCVFYCGGSSFARTTFKEAVYGLYLNGQVNTELRFNQDAFDSAWNRRRVYMWADPDDKGFDTLPLIGLIAYTSDCRATDPRDRIYSLLGLVSKDDRDIVGDPEYGDGFSKFMAYRKLVIYYIRKYNNIDVIGLATLFRHENTANETWPSWVPDWEINQSPRVIPTMGSQSRGKIGNFRPDRLWDTADAEVYDASGGREAILWLEEDENALLEEDKDIQLKSDERHMRSRKETSNMLLDEDQNGFRCQGVILGQVDGIGGTNFMRCQQPTSQINVGTNFKGIERTESQIANLRSLGVAITRTLLLDRADRYLHNPSDPERIYAKLQDLARAAGDPSIRIKPFLDRFFRHNKDFMIRGVTYGSVFLDVPGPENPHKDLHTDGLSKRMSDSINQMEKRLIVTEEGLLGMAPRQSPEMTLQYSDNMMEKRLIVTDDGLIGMAPHEVKKGDVVCVLRGGSTPFVLRRLADGGYSLVGECYMDGFMKGEAYDGEPTEEAFWIR